MRDLRARELRNGEEHLWLELDVPEKGETAESASGGLDEFRARFREESSGDPRTFLIALDGSLPAGRLSGRFLDKQTYLVRELRCAEGFPVSEVEDALLAFLGRSLARDGALVFTSDSPKNAELVGALERAGFTVEKKKALVGRGLEGELPGQGIGFAFVPLAEVGRRRFVEVMTEAAEGDPFESMEGRDADADFEELVELAGNRYDPWSWFLALVDGEVVGVLLPQILPDAESEGTLFYVGVLPRFRGRGYGRALHAAGLSMLAERGAVGYFGSTDTRNEPMLRVFARNGCERRSTQLFFRPPAP
jgi:GNAT superfamily N-acetyltransferase